MQLETDEAASALHRRDCSKGVFNTTIEANQMILYGNTFVIGVCALVIFISSMGGLGGDILFQIYTSIDQLALAILITSITIIAVCVLGAYGGFRKRKRYIKAFMVLTALLIVTQYILSSFVYSSLSTDKISVLAEEEFRTGWISVVEQITDGTDDRSGEARAFITDVETIGECCGYDSATDTTQNPSDEIPCVSTTPCKEYFKLFVIEAMSPLFAGYIALTTVMLALLVGTAMAVCALVPIPSVHYANGAFYEAATLRYA